MVDLGSVLAVLVGGAASATGGYWLEKTRWQRTYVTRWDERKLDTCAEYLASTSATISTISDVANATAEGRLEDASSLLVQFQARRADALTLLARIRMIAPDVWPLGNALYAEVRDLRRLARAGTATDTDEWMAVHRSTVALRDRFTQAVHEELDTAKLSRRRRRRSGAA